MDDKSMKEKDVKKDEQDVVSEVEALDPEDAKDEAESKETSKDAAKKESKKKNKRKHSTLCVVLSSIITAVAVLIIAGVSFYFYAGGGLRGKVVVSESELNAPFAFYYYHGPHQVTVKEVLEYFNEIDLAKTDDGMYYVPGAQDVTSFIQDMVCLNKAAEEGFTVNEAETNAAALYYNQTKDYSEIANDDEISEEDAKEDMQQHALFLKYECEQIASIADNGTVAPEVPSDADMETATSAYADYIKNLVGDAWNSETNTWSEDDATFSLYFKGNEFNGNEATYEQAELAYFLYCTDVLAQEESVNQAISDMLAGFLAHTMVFLPNAQ